MLCRAQDHKRIYFTLVCCQNGFYMLYYIYGVKIMSSEFLIYIRISGLFFISEFFIYRRF